MNCKLIGSLFQALEISLDINESFYAERSAMIYMDSGIDQQVEMAGKGIVGALSTTLSGESLFLMKYTNRSSKVQKLLISGRSGSLKHIKISQGHTLIIRKGDYVGSNNKVQVDLSLSLNKFLVGAGLGFQKVTGDSTVFFDCVDSLIERELRSGEEIIVDESHIKAMLDIEDSQISAQRNTNIVRNLISGEGFLLTRIVGPGRVFFSSIPAQIK